MSQNTKNIRNFVIIAHIDHGKSTLADRFLELTGTVPKDKLRPQMLDQLALERERGITIKLAPVQMHWKGHTLNLIDTPGHVDFSYEVSRALAAVEGAILLVDATQGIQAQTLANLELARSQGLSIIGVVNKIDLPEAKIEQSRGELAVLLGISEYEIFLCSAKTGEGVGDILDALFKRIPPPKVSPTVDPLRALVFDSFYNPFKGVVAYVRVVDGAVSPAKSIHLIAANTETKALEVGIFTPALSPTSELPVGGIGYIVTGLKDLTKVRVGDTVTQSPIPEGIEQLPGYQEPKPNVFASFFPASSEVAKLRTALEKLKLNDASFQYQPEHSQAFGAGFQLGFLGLLHLEIVKERLEREYGLDLVVTTPRVAYRITQETGHEVIAEPWVQLEIITPQQYVGPIMELTTQARGIYKTTRYAGDRAILVFEAPLAVLLVRFYDDLKSISSGFASMSYTHIGYRTGDLVRLDILVAGEKVEEFSRIVPKVTAQKEAQELARKLKEVIPRQLFEVIIQATVGGKILAREDIPPLRKDVIAKLYGGDVTRKRKLLEKQKAGKRKMKRLGRVDIPTDVFLKLLRI